MIQIVKELFNGLEDLLDQIPVQLFGKDKPPELQIIIEKWVIEFNKKFGEVLPLKIINRNYYGKSFFFVTKDKEEYIFPWIVFYSDKTSPKTLFQSMKKNILDEWKKPWTWQDLQDKILNEYLNHAGATTGLSAFQSEITRFYLHVWGSVPFPYPFFINGLKDKSFFNNYKSIYSNNITYEQVLDNFYERRWYNLWSNITFVPQAWNLKGIIQRFEDIHLIENKNEIGIIYDTIEPKFIISWFDENLSRRNPMYRYQIENIHNWWNLNHLEQSEQIDSNYTWGLPRISDYFKDYSSLNIEIRKTQLIPDWELILPVDSSDYQLHEDSKTLISTELIQEENNRIETGWNPFEKYSRYEKKTEGETLFLRKNNPIYSLFDIYIAVRHAPKKISHTIFIDYNAHQKKKITNDIIPFLKSWTFNGVLFELKNGILLKFFTPSHYPGSTLDEVKLFFDSQNINCEIYSPLINSMNKIRTNRLPKSKFFDDGTHRWSFKTDF